MRTIYLLRHSMPQTANSVQRWCLGCHSDPPLSGPGYNAAMELADSFRNLSIRAVGTSPLIRCRETAALVFPGIPATLIPGMVEMDFGKWDGLNFDEIRLNFPEHYALRGCDPSLPPPGGEEWESAANRGINALTEFIHATSGNIAVISHAGIIRAMLCKLSRKPYTENREFPVPYLSMHLLSYDGSKLVVESLQKGSDVV